MDPPEGSALVPVWPPSWKTDAIADGDTETVTCVAVSGPLFVTASGFVVAAECVHWAGKFNGSGDALMLADAMATTAGTNTSVPTTSSLKARRMCAG